MILRKAEIILRCLNQSRFMGKTTDIASVIIQESHDE